MAVRRGALVGMAVGVCVLAACQGGTSSTTSEIARPPETSPAASQATTQPTTSPAETSDGLELVFQATGSIWTQIAGEEKRPVAAAVPTDNQHPDWSPDGKQIAFEANFNKIWTVAGDGTGEHEWFACEEPCAAAYEPAWSPDGETLVFVHILGDGTHTVAAQLMSLDLAGGSTTVIHEDRSGDVWEYTPRWSGDGSHLVVEHDVFASNRLDEAQTLSSELRVVDATTGEATPIPGTTGAQTPDWSPTEDLLVYTDGVNLFTIRPDGAARERLTRFSGKRQSAIQPTFTPDGEGVVFTWVKGGQGSGAETTLPGILDLASGDVTAFWEATGATHVRVRP